jgi:hypothetical protein
MDITKQTVIQPANRLPYVTWKAILDATMQELSNLTSDDLPFNWDYHTSFVNNRSPIWTAHKALGLV